jgi:small subunit ribosomal protein S1
MHTAQMEKTAADEAQEAANAAAGYSSETGATPSEDGAPAAAAPESTGGSLASDAQLAALREKLSGNA